MTDGWSLVMSAPGGDPARVVAGLPLALRLALDAQAGGAQEVVLEAEARSVKPLLGDPRLTIRVTEKESGAPATFSAPYQLRVPASLVVHRRLFGVARECDKRSGKPHRDLLKEPFQLNTPYGFQAIDVVDAATAKTAEAALFRSLRKAEDGWTSRWLNRPLSLGVSKQLVKTSLRPNQVTAVILAVGLLGAVFAGIGGYGYALLGALLFHTQSVLDGCDGEISRVTHRGSKLGEWLDTIGDDITNYAFFIAAAFGLYRSGGEAFIWAVGWAGVLLGMIASGIEYRYLIRIGSGDLLKYPLSAGAGDPDSFSAKIQPLFKRDTFVFLTLISALLNALTVMVVAFAVGSVVVLGNVISTEIRIRGSEGDAG